MATTTTNHTDFPMADWLGLIRAEYLELPDLHLTLPQARRLWGLNEAMTHAVLAALVDAGFLAQTRTGAYVRRR
jgi:DNA-binding IclR family transcriptional regulator